jgi:hypothetical protein
LAGLKVQLLAIWREKWNAAFREVRIDMVMMYNEPQKGAEG